MMQGDSWWLGWSVAITMVMLGLSMVFAFIRLVRGPTLPDRVVALDLFATLVVGIIAVDAISTARPETLRAAIVLALITFLGTVAFAKYVEKRGSE
jgi:multicomponent Na+:H+ antiporter subunit F